MDFHNRRQMFPLSMSLDLEAPPTEKSVVDCLRARRCHPHAFGIPLSSGTTRALQSALAPFEFGRRSLRWAYRSLKSARSETVRQAIEN
jgi:hypothetical protein